GSETFELDVEPSMTVLELKEKCKERAGVEADKQRLIFRGRIVKDPETLESLKIEAGNTIHLVRSLPKTTATSAQNTSNPPSATPGKSATFSENTTPVPGSAPNMPGMGGMPFMPGMGGMPGMEGMGAMPGMGGNSFADGFGFQGTGMPDINPQAAAALLNSPMMEQVMQQIRDNPQLLRTMVESNPFLQSMMSQNQMFNNMINNPEMVRTMMQPGMLQAGLQMHQAMQQQQQRGGTMPGGFPMGMMGQMSPSTPMAPTTTATRPPREMYASQLQTLQEMGFLDTDENIAALTACGGDISAAISRLLQDLYSLSWGVSTEMNVLVVFRSVEMRHVMRLPYTLMQVMRKT
ncbi:bifunctional Ubiquitin-like domain/Ubiquitin-like domain superfamily/Ubiquitin-associated domain/UBA-like superfamily/Ubiquitin domain, partial [Babesia duncani]